MVPAWQTVLIMDPTLPTNDSVHEIIWPQLIQRSRRYFARKTYLPIQLRGQIRGSKPQSGMAPSSMEEYLRSADGMGRIVEQLAEIWEVIGSIKDTLRKPGLRQNFTAQA